MVESAGELPRSGHPIFARLYPLLDDQSEKLFESFEECKTYTQLLDKTLSEHGEEHKELK